MKCAKEVMERWKATANKRYQEDLCEMVDKITEELFTRAGEGRNDIPCVGVDTKAIEHGIPGAVLIKMGGERNYYHTVIWKDLLTVLNSLCYHVNEGYGWHTITPNPSC